MDSWMLSTHTKNLPVSGLTLELTRVPSFIIGIYLVFFLLIVIACYLSFPIISVFLLFLLVITSYGQFLLRKSLLRNHPAAVKKLVFTELTWCYVCFNNGRIIKADIDVDSILTEHLIIVNLIEQSEGSIFCDFFKRHSVILTANELGGDLFRRTKRHLRLINFSKRNEV